ncbi:Npt1/Npt2 family nucleotide transporter [Candidatus Poribacteria bacterium]
MSQLGWKHRVKSLVDIRQDEFRQTLLMFAYNFLIFGAHTIVKTVQKALFLNQAGADKLPYVYIGIALVAGGVMQVYRGFAKSTRRNRSIVWINLFFVSNMMVFWWLFGQYEQPWLSYVLYIWAGVFSAISIAQFWLIVSDVFSIRQAKRLLGIILSGGTLGAILAGGAARWLADITSPQNLFLVTIAQLVGCSIIAGQIRFQGTAATDSSRTLSSNQDVGNAFTLIRKSKHLMLLAMVVGITVLATTIVDFQFSKIAAETYETVSDLTGFFGSYYAYISAITILFQLLITGGLLKRFGVGIAILIMPVGLALGSAAIMFQPVLWAAILLKTCDDIFSPSINKWSMEILYIPIATAIKSRTKTFIDVVVERTSKGIGGLVLLFFILVVPISVRQLGIPTLIFLLGWIFLCIPIYREYKKLLNETIAGRDLDIETLEVDLYDSSTLRILFPLLDSENNRQVIYALELLQDVENPELVDRVRLLCDHPSSKVRTLALRILFNIGDPGFVSHIEALLEDESEEVRAEAIHYVSVYGEVPAAEKLRSFLMHPDYKMKRAAIICITRYGSDEERALLTEELIEQMLSEEGDNRRLARLSAAEALGAVDTAPAKQHLFDLLNDEDLEVVRRAALSAGRSRSVDFVPSLVEMLGDPTVRVSVRSALAAYGSEILDTLAMTMADGQLPMPVRRQIPRVIGMIPHQNSADVLLSHLEHDGMDMRYKIVRALEDLRTVPMNIRFERDLVEDYVTRRIKDYYNLSIILEAQNGGVPPDNAGDSSTSDLLQQALQERLDLYKEMIFRLLGLIYSSESMYNTYRGVTSYNPRVRGNAVELLDNILDRSIKRILFPIIDDASKTLFMEQASALWALQPMTKKEAITALINGQDNWLKACTLHTIGEEGMVELQEHVVAARGSSDLLVNESAEFAWQRLRPDQG